MRDVHKKPICLLIDGLEQINGEGDARFQQVFCYTHLLAEPPWIAAIAAPPSTLTTTSPANAAGYRSLPVYGFDVESGDEVNTLVKLLGLRFQDAGIYPDRAVEGGALAEIARMSGGLPRHAVWMARFALREVIRAGADVMSRQHVDDGIQKVGEELALGVTSEDLRILDKVHTSRELPDGNEKAARLFGRNRSGLPLRR